MGEEGGGENIKKSKKKKNIKKPCMHIKFSRKTVAGLKSLKYETKVWFISYTWSHLSVLNLCPVHLFYNVCKE